MPLAVRCVSLLVRAFVVALLALGLAAQKAKEPKAVPLPKPGQAIEVVFVGNSYTHFHDLPAMVKALGKAQKPSREVTTIMLAPGGFTLQQHWDATGEQAPREVLKARKPDYVVLQEQSRRPIDEPAKLHEYAAKFAALCKERQAVPVWYMTWARAAEPTAQAKLTEQYTAAWRQGGGLLAPVGVAWQQVLAGKDAPKLHTDDGSHPSPAGSYLAACVLYATMCGGDVATFPDRLVVADENGKDRVLVELEPALGKQLRAAAAAVLTATAAKPAKK